MTDHINLTYEQKLAALKAIAPTHLEMRKPGDWYVCASDRAVKKTGSVMLTGAYGNGESPEAAVNDDWEHMLAAGKDGFIVIGAGLPSRKHVRWNGFMWESLPVPEQGGANQ